jgi:hypothetical protein
MRNQVDPAALLVAVLAGVLTPSLPPTHRV